MSKIIQYYIYALLKDNDYLFCNGDLQRTTSYSNFPSRHNLVDSIFMEQDKETIKSLRKQIDSIPISNTVINIATIDNRVIKTFYFTKLKNTPRKTETGIHDMQTLRMANKYGYTPHFKLLLSLHGITFT